MILIVTPDMKSQYRPEISEYFKIRKMVFSDQLGWDVRCDGDMEYDLYDFMPCSYIIAMTDEGEVTGGLRQMSLAGPTLTWEKFSDLVDDPTLLFRPNSWETTRFAIHPSLKDIRSASGTSRIALELSAAALEYGLTQGARHHVAVCEERVVRLTQMFGIPLQVLGRRAMQDEDDILCVAWEVSDASLSRIRWAREKYQAA